MEVRRTVLDVRGVAQTLAVLLLLAVLGSFLPAICVDTVACAALGAASRAEIFEVRDPHPLPRMPDGSVITCGSSRRRPRRRRVEKEPRRLPPFVGLQFHTRPVLTVYGLLVFACNACGPLRTLKYALALGVPVPVHARTSFTPLSKASCVQGTFIGTNSLSSQGRCRL